MSEKDLTSVETAYAGYPAGFLMIWGIRGLTWHGR